MVNSGTRELIGHDIMNYLISIIGLFVALIRISEPIVWQALCDAISCSSKKTGHEMYDDDSLSSFLNSAMNTEYVILIVGGIQHFFKEQKGDKLKSTPSMVLGESTSSISHQFTTVHVKKIDIGRETWNIS